ncbi:hypothetical protein ACFPVY_05525 [Flavobacterium qiangtangense]|uniref:Uncharacterized protein n=1 Tax=Flavobacterium qiangtangense TaxID=1442595 RepID=A0ABW1PKH7_9FLAO
MEDLMNRFPELKVNQKSGSKFELVKSVKDFKSDFEIQLYSESDSIDNKQQIIVLINSEEECSSIPFFGNKYKDYWEFSFDKPIENVNKINSTFTRELNNALKIFPITDNPKNCNFEVVEEMLQSLLVCQKIEEKDSLSVVKTLNLNSDIPNEQRESAFSRIRKNYEKMKKDWHPKDFFSNYNCYYDERRGRIYQINYDEDCKNYRITTYRQDFGFTAVSM